MGIAKTDSDPAFLVDGVPPLDRGRIYRGVLLVFRGLPAMLALVARARALADAAYAPHPPPLAQDAFGPGEFLARRRSSAGGSCATRRPARPFEP